ncbi:MAG: DUF4423 domain-containing protein [Proteobacteria bacterium]|nr:DUF4423 domain-containing protein [Pseudomonadota bacterium]
MKSLSKKAFEVSNHHELLEHFLEHLPRGTKSLLATHLRVQGAFLSQVISGKNNLTPDMAFLAAEFLGLPILETKFLLTMVQRDRCANSRLRKIYDTELHDIRTSSNRIKNLVSADRLSIEHGSVYYSNWWYSAIHILTALNEFQSPQAIADRLRLSLSLVLQVLGFLADCGLVQSDSGLFKISNKRIHEPEDSPNIDRHHANWRIRSAAIPSNNSFSALRYTGAIAISKKDAEVIREIFLNAISKAEKILHDSKEESLYALIIDFAEI